MVLELFSTEKTAHRNVWIIEINSELVPGKNM